MCIRSEVCFGHPDVARYQWCAALQVRGTTGRRCALAVIWIWLRKQQLCKQRKKEARAVWIAESFHATKLDLA